MAQGLLQDAGPCWRLQPRALQRCLWGRTGGRLLEGGSCHSGVCSVPCSVLTYFGARTRAASWVTLSLKAGAATLLQKIR